MKGPGFVCDHCGHHDVVKSNNEAFRADPTGLVPLGWYEVKFLEGPVDAAGERQVPYPTSAHLCTADCLIAWTQAREDATQ